jgi:hypothetical protein
MGSQSALANSRMAAQLTGLKPEQVYFHQTFLGGGFGRRSNGDELRHAILVAQAGKIDVPLQLLWSREQDMRADRFRPQSAIRMKGALSPDGRLEALHIESACGSIQRSGDPGEEGEGVGGGQVCRLGHGCPGVGMCPSIPIMGGKPSRAATYHCFPVTRRYSPRAFGARRIFARRHPSHWSVDA